MRQCTLPATCLPFFGRQLPRDSHCLFDMRWDRRTALIGIIQGKPDRGGVAEEHPLSILHPLCRRRTGRDRIEVGRQQTTAQDGASRSSRGRENIAVMSLPLHPPRFRPPQTQRWGAMSSVFATILARSFAARRGDRNAVIMRPIPTPRQR